MDSCQLTVARCSVQNWLELFREFTNQCELVELTGSFVDYLLSDGTLVTNCISSSASSSVSSSLSSDTSPDRILQPLSNGSCEAENDKLTENGRTSPSSSQLHRPDFAEIDQRIIEALDRLGGSAFVKLNWHAPLDTRWLTLSGSLRCQCVDDIHLVLRASQRLHYDLSHCQSSSHDDDRRLDVSPTLALWKWTDIHPSSEFRCFIRHGHLIGICQRDISQFFGHLEARRDLIVCQIVSFFSRVVKPRLAIDNYMLDVYFRDEGSDDDDEDRIRVLDVNPLCSPWQSLLFTWRQLSGELCMRCETSTGAEWRCPLAYQPLCPLCREQADVPVVQLIAGGDSVQQPVPYSQCHVSPCDLSVLNAAILTHNSQSSHLSGDLINLIRQSQIDDSSSSDEQ